MKTYTIREDRWSYRGVRSHEYSGTLEELTNIFSYTLEVGRSWERERGNKKISIHPKTAESLVKNLNNAVNNAAANGCASKSYWLVNVVSE